MRWGDASPSATVTAMTSEAGRSTQNSAPDASGTDANGERGGFRIDMAVSTDRGGPRYGEFNEQVRRLMDNARYACPTDDLVDGLIADLESVNRRLETVLSDEWTSPSGTRIDLPARGNVTLPPFVVTEASAEGVTAEVTFRGFHLGGNNAAHGGHIALAFDDLGGMASALKVLGITRTGYLTVNYRSLTPLQTPLTMKTWVAELDGRKAFVRGTLHDGDRLCADMDALFIALRPGQP